MENKYRKYIARDHSASDVNQFVETMESRLEYNINMDVRERAMRLVDNMVQALDVVAPKNQFKIARIWEGERWFIEEIRETAARRDEAYREALYEDTELYWLHYKRERNTVVKLIKVKKKNTTKM